jgi:hypothetical protein
MAGAGDGAGRSHRQPAAASGNDVAEALLSDLNDRIRILRIYDFTTDDRIGATIVRERVGSAPARMFELPSST